MARFRVTAKGKGKVGVSRLGHSSSGAETTCRGWNLGATCYAEATGVKTDMISVVLDDGSAERDSAYGYVYLFRDERNTPVIQLGTGTAKYLEINDDFIQRLLQYPEQVKKLRGLLFVNGAAHEAP